LDVQWSLIDFLATPPDLRDLDWTPKLEREKVDTMASWCRANGVRSQEPAKWHASSPWFRHYLKMVKEQRATHDYMIAQMLEKMYIAGQKDHRAQRGYLDYVKEFGETVPTTVTTDEGSVDPTRMTDEALDAMLGD